MYVKESVYIYDLWSSSFVFLWSSSFVFYSCQLAPCYYISLDDKSPWRTYAILSPYIHLHFNQIAITMAHINSTLSIFSNCCFKSFWPWRQQSMTSYKWILRESSPTAELYVTWISTMETISSLELRVILDFSVWILLDVCSFLLFHSFYWETLLTGCSVLHIFPLCTDRISGNRMNTVVLLLKGSSW